MERPPALVMGPEAVACFKSGGFGSGAADSAISGDASTEASGVTSTAASTSGTVVGDGVGLQAKRPSATQTVRMEGFTGPS